MNSNEFVLAVDAAAKQSAVRSIVANLTHPTGKRPDPSLVFAARWFAALPVEERTIVISLLARASHYAILNILAILDNALPLERGSDCGSLELHHVRGQDRSLINRPDLGLEELLPPLDLNQSIRADIDVLKENGVDRKQIADGARRGRSFIRSLPGPGGDPT